MKLGIIGLPQCGKTTFFNALTQDYNPTGQKVVDTTIDQLKASWQGTFNW